MFGEKRKEIIPWAASKNCFLTLINDYSLIYPNQYPGKMERLLKLFFLRVQGSFSGKLSIGYG